MNRDCNGTFFQIIDKHFYKCFLDGAIMNLDWFERRLNDGVTCPNCKRVIDGQRAGAAVQFSQFKVFRLEDGSSVVMD